MFYKPYSHTPFRNIFILLFFIATAIVFSACGPYTFKDVSIPPEVKTIKINFIENRAPYKNPQLAARLTDQLQQKVANLTRRTVTQSDNADYIISGYISSYNVSTAAISGQQAAANRLTVGLTMTLFNTLENKSTDYQVSRDFDFSAGLTLSQAEAQLLDDIIKNVTDEIFNRLFSNW
ncbi:LPS assembly lipoprotein LptE [Panacibacter microcysteis]|uniref:LPS assembly lipoprotein LptE n=1 Tax=Panacibacter microcysteis TaxID=2793269 RepID=UPI001E429327|nr:LptE family protein [Panacibacter microcysteis]